MRERVMKWLQIKRYNWKNYDIFLIAVVLILTFISSYVISIVNSDISLIVIIMKCLLSLDINTIRLHVALRSRQIQISFSHKK